MDGLILYLQGFGIGDYIAQLAEVSADAVREFSLLQAVTLTTLLGVGGAMALLGVIRRSAVAWVSALFLVSVAGVCAVVLGLLENVGTGAQLFLIAIATCAYLFFITATLRMARDNPFIGFVVLIGILGLLVVGAMTGMSAYDGAAIIGMGVIFAGALTAIILAVEFVRRDGPSLAVAPGIVAFVIGPVLMAALSGRPIDDWFTISLPVIVMSTGAVVAALTAVLMTMLPARSRAVAGGFADAAAVAGAGVGAAAMAFRGDDERQADEVPPMAADRSRGDAAAETVESDGFWQDLSAEPDPAPEERPTARQEPSFTAPSTSAPTPPPAPPPAPAPYSGAHEDTAPTDPVSAQWGVDRGQRARTGAAGAPVIADDEYVWDSLASDEVRMGDRFRGTFALPADLVATPDVLRDTLAPRSLAAFDEDVLGGALPATARFDLSLVTNSGDEVDVHGRRQVDQDGLLSRLELTVTSVRGATPTHETVVPGMPAAPAESEDAALARQAVRALTAHAEPAVDALDTGAIETHFQPIVRLSDGVTIGFEALARWRQPDGSLREPRDFIDALIRMGRGPELTVKMINEAAAELADWVAAEPGAGQFVTVNLSSSDLPAPEVAEAIAAAMRAHNLPRGSLIIELGEGRISTSQAKALSAAKALKAAGAGLALDDFGTGHATLSRLSRFEFDLVKTDKSLVTDLGSVKKKKSALKSIVANAQKAGALVVAEGIEDAETASLVSGLGCAFGQGYHFGAAEPLDVDQAPAPAPSLDEKPPVAPPPMNPFKGDVSDLR